MRIVSLVTILAAACAFGQNSATNSAVQVAAIHESAATGDLENLKALLDQHPELIDVRQQFQQPRKPSITDGYTALMRAARAGKEKVVEYLIERGSDVNAADGMGWTALHVAAQQGNLAIVKLLVKKGAKVSAQTVRIPKATVPSRPPGEPPLTYEVPSQTPLDLAVAAKHPEVANYLKSISEK